PEDCASTVMNCASNSTCGKPGFVTCCETDASGTTKCNVVNGPDACTAPKGGSACVGTQPSCCDACASGECGGGGGTTTGTTATTTTTSTTTTTVSSCSCAGGAPSQVSFTTGVGSGTCGHLASDTSANFLSLNCGGLYFGGAGVGVPLPSTVPDQGKSFSKAACTGTAITLSGTSPTEAGGNRCSG